MPDPSPSGARRDTLMGALGLLALTGLVFGQVIGFDFTNFDDPLYVTSNRHVMAGLGWDGIAWAFRTGWASNWHPLTWLSHMADVSLFGLDAGWHHGVSALLHVANAILLYLLLKAMTRAQGPSLVAAALFAVHPLHVESVAWVAERKDVLSMFFALLCLWQYHRYVVTRSLWALARSCLLFALGLMAKPMLVSLPILLLLLDRWPLDRVDRKSILLLEKVPFAMLAFLSCLVTLQVQRAGGAMHTLAGLNFKWRAMNAVVSYGAYLGRTFWPFRLSVFYPFPGIRQFLWAVPLASMVLLAITWAVWAQRGRRPALLMGWLWYLVALVPVIGLVQVGMQGMADRYTYLPLVGPMVALSTVGAEWAASLRWPRVAVTVLIGGLAVLSWFQVRTWRNSETLFRHALAVDPANYVASANLGFELYTQGRCAEALPHLSSAARLMPLLVKPHYFLARDLLCLGRREEGLAELRRTLDLNPHFHDAMFEAAGPLMELGRDREAWALLSAFRREEPLRLQGNADPAREKARSAAAVAMMAEIRRRNPF